MKEMHILFFVTNSRLDGNKFVELVVVIEKNSIYNQIG